MKKESLSLLCALLAACATNPPVRVAPWVGVHANACVPEAIAMSQGLRDSGIQARVLIFETPTYSHAVAVYLYPAGNANVWVWDSYWKSTQVRADWRDPAGIARAWLRKCGRSERVLSARFLEGAE